MYDPHGGTVESTYDALGRRSTMTDPDDGVTTYTYDEAGRLTRLVNPESETTTFLYDDLNREIARLLDNGTRTSMTYDAAGNEVSRVHLDNTSAGGPAGTAGCRRHKMTRPVIPVNGGVDMPECRSSCRFAPRPKRPGYPRGGLYASASGQPGFSAILRDLCGELTASTRMVLKLDAHLRGHSLRC